MHPQKQKLEGGMKASGIYASSVILIAVVWLLLASVPAYGMITFERTYGGISWDCGNSVQQTRDGGYVVAGFTESFGAGYRDFYLVKTDSLGNLMWDGTYGDSLSNEYGYSVQQTSDGGYIVAGTTVGPSGTNVYLVKTDSLGDTLWTRTHGDSLYQEGYSVVETQDGGYIIAGQTRPLPPFDTCDEYLVKTDSLGDTLWTKTFDGNLADRGFSVQQTPYGGYIIAGYTGSYVPGLTDVYLIKTDSLGDTLWTRTYDLGFGDTGYSVDQTLDGGYVITGSTGDWPLYEVYLVRTDSVGTLLWERTYPGGGFPDMGESVQETSDGGYVVAGYTGSFGAGYYDVYLIKTDSLGRVVGIQEQDRELKIEKRKSLQNQPNPFHGSTVISYSLPASSHVALQIFDIAGRLVETLVNETQERGPYQVQWNSNDNPSGIYFCRLQAGDFTDTKKMTLLR